MRRNGERVTELGGLADGLYVRGYMSDKTSAHLEINLAARTCTLHEYFDTGKGHSGAFYSNTSPVDMEVFEEAVRRGYVSGKLEPGYVSSTIFVLTRNEFLLEQVRMLADEWRDKDHWRKVSAYEIEHGKGPGTYIRIISMPDGKEPEELRQAWVGHFFPAHPIIGYSEDRGNSLKRYFYSVPQAKALEILADRNKPAADLWKEHGYPKDEESGSFFHFSVPEVEEIAGKFIYQKIEIITEEP